MSARPRHGFSPAAANAADCRPPARMTAGREPAPSRFTLHHAVEHTLQRGAAARLGRYELEVRAGEHHLRDVAGDLEEVSAAGFVQLGEYVVQEDDRVFTAL